MKQTKIGTLGPKGTFSHQAALKCDKYLRNLGLDPVLHFEPSIPVLFRKGTEKYDIILVPVENSEAGPIGFVMDWLIETNKQNMLIVGEIDMRINHYLSGWGTIEEITDLYAHPQSYNQCEQFINLNLPKVRIHQTLSNGDSARKIIKNKIPAHAAIVPKICAEIYKLPIIQPKIQNSENNSTRFVLCSRQKEIQEKFRTKIAAKSSIIMDPRDDHPGLLNEILDIFAQRMINLTKIQSRPSKRALGDYIFYIDLQGDLLHVRNEECLIQLKRKSDYRILGCYNQIRTH